MENFPVKGVINFFLSLTIWHVAKVMFCLVFGLYIFFSVVVLRQISLMTETLNGQFELPLKLVGVLNLALAIFLFVGALLIL